MWLGGYRHSRVHRQMSLRGCGRLKGQSLDTPVWFRLSCVQWGYGICVGVVMGVVIGLCRWGVSATMPS